MLSFSKKKRKKIIEIIFIMDIDLLFICSVRPNWLLTWWPCHVCMWVLLSDQIASQMLLTSYWIIVFRREDDTETSRLIIHWMLFSLEIPVLRQMFIPVIYAFMAFTNLLGTDSCILYENLFHWFVIHDKCGCNRRAVDIINTVYFSTSYCLIFYKYD